MDALLARAQPVLHATTDASHSAIAATATLRQPLVWKRSQGGFTRRWRAHDRWSDSSVLNHALQWAIARVDESGNGEFVLTAPQRGGTAALLNAAPAWEPLRTSTRNVSVSEILAGGLMSGGSGGSGSGGGAKGGSGGGSARRAGRRARGRTGRS